jgi:hypothetical protein
MSHSVFGRFARRLSVVLRHKARLASMLIIPIFDSILAQPSRSTSHADDDLETQR